MKRRVVATDTYSTQHSPPTCNRPMTQVERDGDFTTRKLNTRGEESAPSAFSSQEGNSMLHLIQMMVIGYFLCLLASSFWQQDKDREGEESQFWRRLCSFLLAFLHSSKQARCCPTAVVSPLPAGLCFRELQNTTFLADCLHY